MRPDLRQYLDTLYHTYHSADAAQADRLHRWRSIKPASAALLAVLVVAKQAQNLLEIGTSGGYSTLWLAEAAAQTGGRLTTLEIDPARHATASQHLHACGLAATALCVDAAAFLRDTEETYDFILLDAERPAYPAYWPDLRRCLARSGSLLVVDNVISHAAQVQDFTALVTAAEDYRHSIVPIGAGLLLVVKQ